MLHNNKNKNITYDFIIPQSLLLVRINADDLSLQMSSFGYGECRRENELRMLPIKVYSDDKEIQIYKHNIQIRMKSTVLSSYSNYGKYLATNYQQEQKSTEFSSITLKQNYIHQRPFQDCKFDIPGNRLYLRDTKGTLIHLNLSDNSFSTLKSQKIKHFTIDGNNSLSLLYVTPQSQLYRVSFENKKPVKIMNLNMSQILSFERNYLRQMILVLDYKLLFLCDLTNPSKIKSLKAGYNQVFTTASFASNNRFLILAVKNIEIKILQIVNLKSVHSIRMPFSIENLKIQVSYDSKKIAIYGDCNIIFFINISEKQQFSYEIIDIPFLKTIHQLKYTYQNEIVFLGNDQILYAISPNDPTKAVPIFNEDYKVRLMGFDISLDCKKMAVISNRTVYGFRFNKGLRSAIEQKQVFKTVQHRQNGFNQEPQVVQKPKQKKKESGYQYEDQDQSEEDSNQDPRYDETINLTSLKLIKGLPKINDHSQEPLNPIISELSVNGIDKQAKVHLNQIFNHIISNYRLSTLGFSQSAALTIAKIYNLVGKKPQKCLNLCVHIFSNITQEFDKFEHYGLVLCPEIISIIEKRFQVNFLQFFKENVIKLFLHYFQETEQVKFFNWLVSNFQTTDTIPLLFISTLEEVLHLIETEQQSWQELIVPQKCKVLFVSVLQRFQKIKRDTRYSNMLGKKRVSDYVIDHEINPVIRPQLPENKLQQLILRQEQIKRALVKIQHDKPNI